MKINLIKICQPIGEFYTGSMNSDDLIKILHSKERNGEIGHQRRLRENRLNEIAKYCNDPDATFPTPIIAAINTPVNLEPTVIPNIYTMNIDDQVTGEILDGQHRLNGIEHSGKNIELPVTFMFNLTEEEKAYIFSTINSNQQKVDRSLIYDLFELSTTRSPYKTCHEIARLLNSSKHSPFFQRLKMLESRTSEMQSLSQGTFVNQVVTLISKKPNDDYIREKNKEKLEDDGSPLRIYYLKGQDEVIYKILFNCFEATRNIFEDEWNNPEKYILTKTVGFNGIIKFLKFNLDKMIKNKDLSIEMFEKIFKNFEVTLNEKNKKLTSEFFKSGQMGENDISKLIEEAYTKINNDLK